MPFTPTTKKGLQTRLTILSAATDVLARDGYAHARMSDIAAGAGLSVGGLYRYFENKTELLDALVEDLPAEFSRRSVISSLELQADPLAALTQANRGYVECYYEHRKVMLILAEAAAIDARFRAVSQTLRDRHVARFTRAYRSAIGVDPALGVSIESATEAMVCMVEQSCYVWFAQHQGDRTPVSVADAVSVASHAWFATMFAGML